MSKDSVELGFYEEDVCNRDGCIGIIKRHETEESCSCHTNPPCSVCTVNREYCDECGWDAQDE